LVRALLPVVAPGIVNTPSDEASECRVSNRARVSVGNTLGENVSPATPYLPLDLLKPVQLLAGCLSERVL
jgi:hypothetical protein